MPSTLTDPMTDASADEPQGKLLQFPVHGDETDDEVPEDEYEFDEEAQDDALFIKPTIYVHDRQLSSLSDEVVAALERANEQTLTLFVQSGALVTVRVNEAGRATITSSIIGPIRWNGNEKSRSEEYSHPFGTGSHLLVLDIMPNNLTTQKRLSWFV